MAFLVDTYGAPTDAELKQPGCLGATRYISHQADKTLTAAQVRHIHGLGKLIVPNFEDAASNAQAGRGQGVADGQFTVAELVGLHCPKGVAPYASADYETHPGWGTWHETLQYFRGWTSALHAAGYRSGAYGNYDLIKALLDAGIVDYGWQAVAWSYGHEDPRAVLLQDKYLGSYDVDEQRAKDLGAWTPTGPQTPAGGTVTPAKPKPATPPDFLEELMALDRNSTEYKQLLADIAAATSTSVWNRVLTFGSGKHAVKATAASWLVNADHYANAAFHSITDGDNLRERLASVQSQLTQIFTGGKR